MDKLRQAQVTMRANKGLLLLVQEKLKKENEENYALAKNKHYFRKKSIADIFEKSMIDYVNN